MKIAFIYSGQGSQYNGMGKDLYTQYDSIKRHFDRADDIFQEALTEVMFNVNTKLDSTRYAQPSIFTFSTAIRDLLEEKGIVSDACAGLSLGEYAAYYDAGVFDFEQGLRTLIHRAYFMQKSSENRPGKMVALLGDKNHLQNLIDAYPGCYIANLNSATQTVVGGDGETMAKVIEAAKSYGFKRATPLNTSGAFHTPLMAEAKQAFEQYLAFQPKRPPQKQLYLNTTGTRYKGEDLHSVMSDQIVQPVQFEAMIDAMVQDGIDVFIEIGPKDVLKKLIKKQVNNQPVFHIENSQTLLDTIEALKELNQ